MRISEIDHKDKIMSEAQTSLWKFILIVYNNKKVTE